MANPEILQGPFSGREKHNGNEIIASFIQDLLTCGLSHNLPCNEGSLAHFSGRTSRGKGAVE